MQRAKREDREAARCTTPGCTHQGLIDTASKGGAGIKGTVEIYGEYQTGLKDLDGFSHIYLIYYFHRSQGFNLSVVPFMDKQPRGLFATRAPKRPNPIGLSVVKLLGIEENFISIECVDLLEGTPVLDIKPYVLEFDRREKVRVGWLETVGNQSAVSDDRFR